MGDHPFATHAKAANFNKNSSATTGEFLVGIHYDYGVMVLSSWHN
jgi:hypothetical protein